MFERSHPSKSSTYVLAIRQKWHFWSKFFYLFMVFFVHSHSIRLMIADCSVIHFFCCCCCCFVLMLLRMSARPVGLVLRRSRDFLMKSNENGLAPFDSLLRVLYCCFSVFFFFLLLLIIVVVFCEWERMKKFSLEDFTHHIAIVSYMCFRDMHSTEPYTLNHIAEYFQISKHMFCQWKLCLIVTIRKKQQTDK